VILRAAGICAYFSDARGSAKVPVDYTLKKYVKKPPKANLGFVIYTDYKTIIVAPNAQADLKDKDE
jgi:predicted ribosome quality control (RQC) complex YloA/Tae2 family protein